MEPKEPLMGMQRVEAAGVGGSEPVGRSRYQVRVRESRWRVHQWQVCAGAGGAVVCRAAALRTAGGGLLLWVGPGHTAPELGAVAVGVPARPEGGGGALGTVLTGTSKEGSAETGAALARRLAAALRRPVHVCCAAAFDRFTAPLVERGLVAEIKSRPECFVEDS